jgi:hypothetical protein
MKHKFPWTTARVMAVICLSAHIALFFVDKERGSTLHWLQMALGIWGIFLLFFYLRRHVSAS